MEQVQREEIQKVILLPGVKEQDESLEIVHCWTGDALLKHLLLLPDGNQWASYKNKLLHRSFTAMK